MQISGTRHASRVSTELAAALAAFCTGSAMLTDASSTGGVATGSIGRGSGKAAAPLSRSAASTELAASSASLCTGSAVLTARATAREHAVAGGVSGRRHRTRIGQRGGAALQIGDGYTVLAHCSCQRCLDVLGAGGYGCCPPVLNRRSGVLDAERTEAREPGSNPTGENDRSAQRPHYSKSARAHHPPPVSSKAPLEPELHRQAPDKTDSPLKVGGRYC